MEVKVFPVVCVFFCFVLFLFLFCAANHSTKLIESVQFSGFWCVQSLYNQQQYLFQDIFVTHKSIFGANGIRLSSACPSPLTPGNH